MYALLMTYDFGVKWILLLIDCLTDGFIDCFRPDKYAKTTLWLMVFIKCKSRFTLGANKKWYIAVIIVDDEKKTIHSLCNEWR